MGALGHYLESEGLATAGISLIRLHTEKIRPPRALWVPFELGRPLGVPSDAAFQTRVLRALVNLLATPTGPVLVDFPEEAPAADPDDMTEMVCPISLPHRDSSDSLPDQVRREVRDFAPWYDLALQRRGRTTFGSAGLGIDALVAFVAAWLALSAPPSPRTDIPADALLKLAVEDLKAYYLEAMQAQPSAADSRALYDWFWQETAAARMIVAIRDSLLASSEPALRLMATNYLVPRAYWEKFGIASAGSRSAQ